jgi:protein O-GlcNAc transferase
MRIGYDTLLCMFIFANIVVLQLTAIINVNGKSIISRNVHSQSIVKDPKDLNKLKAEQMNTKAMQIEAVSVKEALQLLLEAYKLDPMNWMINANLANVYSNFEQQISSEISPEQRINYINKIFFHSENALALNPNHAGLLNNHGILLKDYNRKDKAIETLKKTISIDPQIHEAHSGLADIYLEMADTELAVNQYSLAMHAVTGVNLDAFKFKIADAMIPRIYLSYNNMIEARAKYNKYILTEVYRINDCSKLLENIGSLGYYLVYQGGNDLFQRTMLARAYRKCAPALLQPASYIKKNENKNMQPKGNDSGDNPTHRVGFISSFLRKHSVGKLIKGIIIELTKHYPNKYDIFVYFIGGINYKDEITNSILASVKRSNVRKFHSSENIEVARKIILNDSLDVLIYPEVGMDHFTYFLAYRRLANVQASFWGHPVTSGIEHTVDYFISSNLFHIHNKRHEENKFIEELYYMNGLTTYFEKPEHVEIDDSFIIDTVGKTFNEHHFSYENNAKMFQNKDYRIYACLQTLYKLTPHFDKVILGILEKDEKGVIVLLKNPNIYYAKRTKQRLEKYIANGSYLKRIVFFDLLAKEDFLKLAKLSDVALDPFPFGGGVSSLEILSTGTPIIVLPTQTSVLQLTLGFYTVMQKDDHRKLLNECCVAETIDEYIDKAVHTASISSHKSDVTTYINNRINKLYANDDVIREWDNFFQFVIGQLHS